MSDSLLNMIENWIWLEILDQNEIKEKKKHNLKWKLKHNFISRISRGEPLRPLPRPTEHLHERLFGGENDVDLRCRY